MGGCRGDLVGIRSADFPPSKKYGGWRAVGGGAWVKKKLIGREILNFVKWWVVFSL